VTRGARTILPTIARHLIGEVLRTFLLMMIAFVAISILVYFFDRFDDFLKQGAPAGTIALLFLYRVPLIVGQVMPIAVLAGALVGLGLLARNNEFVALRSCGVSLGQITLPLVALAVLIALANFLWDEGALITVLDWEMAYVGDPLYDLGYIVALMPSTVGERGFPPFNDLPGWWNRGRILDTWENHTSRSAEHVGRYEVLAMGMVTTLFARGIQLVRRGESCDPRYVAWERSLPWFLDRMQKRAQAPIP